MKALLIFVFTVAIAVGCLNLPARSHNHLAESSNKVLLTSDVNWEALNPARGDQSPQAGTLWGDRQGTAPTGFLAKFVDGFSSPPHIHNVTYRAVVISGNIHNDDPDAAKMWMPPGSFWTQPEGESHITAAKGDLNMALVEIDRGPYLVIPPEKAFDTGERPINVDVDNIVWVDPPGFSASANGPKLAYLWGSIDEDHENGTFIKLPAGFKGEIDSHASIFRAVVIKGAPKYLGTNQQTLEPGSYFSSKGKFIHQVSSSVGEETVLYVRTRGQYELTKS